MSDQQCWNEYEKGNFDEAAKLWTQLISNETIIQNKNRYLSNYCYALTALKRFDEAENIYQKLFESTGSHRFLHQLAMVYRESSQFPRAIQILRQEQTLILNDNHLAIAANYYELGKVHQLSQQFDEAYDYSFKCLNHAIKCEDLIMHACAFRLLGDLYEKDDTSKSIEYYYKSADSFSIAEDTIGKNEVLEKIKTLNNRQKKIEFRT